MQAPVAKFPNSSSKRRHVMGGLPKVNLRSIVGVQLRSIISIASSYRQGFEKEEFLQLTSAMASQMVEQAPSLPSSSRSNQEVVPPDLDTDNIHTTAEEFEG